jgi:PKHD-type hydroxylase
MLVHIRQALTADQVRFIRQRLDEVDDAWVDGRVTAGYQGAPVKRNRQIDENAPVARELGDIILGALERNQVFISAALPRHVYPPMFNRYSDAMEFGSHVDGAIRISSRTGNPLRTDLSATLFLADPTSYDGGELQIEDAYGVHSVKLPAGDLILYPATSLHRVTAVTRGIRIASFFWVQSMVREDNQRTLLYDMDNAIQQLNATHADETARTRLVSCYHNLLRMWADT